MERVSKHSPFQSQRQTQPKSNTEDEKKEEEDRMAESEGDDEEKGSFSPDEKKKGKMSMKAKKQKQEYRSINKMMDGPGGKAKGVVIGGRAAANESDAEKPPASKRRKHAHTEVKSLYSLRSENKDSDEKEPKGKEKEQETDENGKNLAEGSDDESESMVREIHIKLEELSW